MQEIEIKAIEIRPQEIISRLEALGATVLFDGEIETIFFDYRDHSLEQARSVLRLRRKGEDVLLALKSFVANQGAKVMVENEVKVDKYEPMLCILEGLGLKEKERMRKHRRSYKLANAEIDMDEYHGNYSFIPPFIEIEGGSQEEIFEIAERLGIPRENCKPWSTSDLINYYSKKR